MNRSYSKIRHIQESNSRLEKRLLGENVEDHEDEKLQQIIDMDQELDDDPTYKKYEREYTSNRLKSMIKDQTGMDVSEMSEEEANAIFEIFASIMDVSKQTKDKMTREKLLGRKDSIINLVIEIMEIAVENDDFEMATKLKNYIKLLEEYN